MIDNLRVIEYFLIRASKEWLQKWVSLSLIMAHGAPNREKIFFFKNLTTTLLSLVLLATTSTHLDL